MLMCLVDTTVVIAAAAVDYYTNMTRYCERVRHAAADTVGTNQLFPIE